MTEERSRRKLAAILSADAVGYSRLMADDEEGTVRTINTYREVITNLIQEHNGRVVDAKGDNLLAEFASVVDAVRCSAEVQKELKVRNADLSEDRKMEFRIGVNLGDVIEEGETIYGDGVNVAARLEGLAESGGLCISGTAFDQVRDKLDLGYEYQGEQTVKNIPRPVRAYKVLMEPEYAGRVFGEKKRKPKQWRWAVSMIVLIIVAGSLAIWNFYLRPPPIEPASSERMAFSLPDRPSIAVLPFKNLSGAQEQEYLADGITENIIMALSKTPKMFVIASNSVFTYKDKPVKVQQVAEEMGVRYVLEGSLQKSGDRLRINAQLIDAIEGHHLWADRYDRQMKDIFAIQDEITKTVIIELQIKLTEGEQARVFPKGTGNLEAYLKVLQARQYIYQFNKEDNIRARQVAEQAIVLDPGYAYAYVMVAWTHFFDCMYRSSKSHVESLALALQLVQKAHAMDDSLPGGYLVKGNIYLIKRQYEKAIAEHKKALALDPNSAGKLTHLGRILQFSGRMEEAIQLYKRALRLNPFPKSFDLAMLGSAYTLTGRYDEAIEASKKAINIEPRDLNARTFLASAYSLSGREVEARAEAEEILRIDPKFSLTRFAETNPYKNKADTQLFVDALRKAGLK